MVFGESGECLIRVPVFIYLSTSSFKFFGMTAGLRLNFFEKNCFKTVPSLAQLIIKNIKIYEIKHVQRIAFSLLFHKMFFRTFPTMFLNFQHRLILFNYFFRSSMKRADCLPFVLPVTFSAPVTEQVFLHSKLLSKNNARASVFCFSRKKIDLNCSPPVFL